MRKTLLMLVMTALSIGLKAQNVRDEIQKDVRCSASQYRVYPEPAQHQTAPPEGKKPFYISHYGRYGSRYNSKRDIYDIPYNIFASADSLGKLTPYGHEVLTRLSIIRQDAYERWGELTETGAEQQRQIISRMVDRFPEVFRDGASIDARSTTVTRCILSMEQALLQLTRMKPRVKIHHNATHRDMVYLNQQDKKLIAMKMDKKTQAQYDAFANRYEDNARLTKALFNDTAYVRQHVKSDKLNYYLFKVASNLQSTERYKTMTLYDVFTADEIYRNWKKENAWWFIAYGGSTINGGLQPYTQRNLLHKIIEQADSCLHLRNPGVQLRYGHETTILPLVCLLDLNGYGLATSDLESLEQHGWADYRIFPASANVQLVFYRNGEQDDDILVKVLLNENEATLPIDSNLAPYYPWRDVRDYYLKKLGTYEQP